MTVRYLLPSATTFYIATNGNDSNDGLSTGTPWLTFAHAMAVLTGQIDFGGQAVTLQAVTGHASFTTGLSVSPWVGGGSLVFDGASGSIAETGNPAILISGGSLPGSFKYQNVTLSSTNNYGLEILSPCNVFQGSGVSLGSCGLTQIAALVGAVLWEALANYDITGGAVFHIQTGNAGVAFYPSAITVTLHSTPAFSGAFVQATQIGVASLGGASFGGSGATGPRFSAVLNGVINTGNAGLNYFPGSSAGVTDTGGRYS